MAIFRTERKLPRRCFGSALALALAGLSAGCSTERIFGSSPAPAPSSSTPAPASTSENSSITSKLGSLFSSKPTAAAPAGTSGQSLGVDPLTFFCPGVDVRQGASTLAIPPGETDAFNVRYQGTIGEMARECKVANGIVTMKVGIQGRILLGPAGSPGTVDIPLRYAIVREGPVPKFIWSKFYKVSVTIPEGAPSVAFTHIDEAVTFPQPPVDEMNSYIVYVGFDPAGDKQPAAKKPAPKPGAKPAPARAAKPPAAAR